MINSSSPAFPDRVPDVCCPCVCPIVVDVAFYVAMIWGSVRMQICMLAAASCLILSYRQALQDFHRFLQPGVQNPWYWLMPLLVIFAAAALAGTAVGFLAANDFAAWQSSITVCFGMLGFMLW